MRLDEAYEAYMRPRGWMKWLALESSNAERHLARAERGDSGEFSSEQQSTVLDFEHTFSLSYS